MEILSKVWILLTTENEMITKIIMAPTTLLEDWIAYLLIINVLNINHVPIQKYLYVFSLSITSIITEFMIPSPYNFIINYLIMFFIIKKIFKFSILKSFLCIIIPTITFALIGILLLKPITLIFNISVNTAQYTPIYDLIYVSILYFFIYLCIKIIQLFKIKYLLKEELSQQNKIIILLNFFLGFFTICVQLAITAFYTDILPLVVTILSCISLFAYFFISFYSLNRVIKLQITTKNLESAENYNATLTYLYDNVKAFKHDFDNMVFIIGGFIDKKDIEGLKKYYTNLEKDCQRVNNIALLNPELINNSGIYNLLIAKYKKAQDLKTEIHLEYFFDFNKLKMPIYDFSRILGILLDNAIEAAKNTKEKQVFIIIRDSSINNTQILSIKNSYINKNIDTSKIFEKGITEKENHSGMGLWEVNQILKRNNNVKLITKKDDLYFEQNLEIYY